MDYKQYQRTTREAYKNKEKADKYKKAYASSLNFKNFKSKIIAFREREIVRSFLHSLWKNREFPKTACDIPVGTGKMTDILLDFGLKLTSGDISREMMEFIDPKLKNHPNYIEERVIDASELPFGDNTFDLIINIRLMQRVDPSTMGRILKEAHRTTKKYYIVSFAIDNLWQNIRLKIRKFIHRDPSPGRIERRRLRKGLQKTGFNIIQEKEVFPIFSNESIFLLEKKE